MDKRLLIARIMGSLCIIALFNAACACRPNAQERYIKVTGNATVYAIPDQAQLAFSVVSRAKNLQKVKQLHDSTVQKTNMLFDTYAIEQKHVTVENLTIHPRYAYRSDVPQFLYYEIEQHISVLITRLENYEPFLTALLDNGIDRINDVRFFAQDVKKYKNEARIAAVKAAEEKALLLCSASSENNAKKLALGRVLRIAEVPLYSYGDSYNAAAQNRIAYAKSADAGMSDMVSAPIGKIRFDARVEMVLELQD